MADVKVAAIDVLLFALVVIRLVKLKRAIDAYRPPSPLPPSRHRDRHTRLTIVRVS